MKELNSLSRFKENLNDITARINRKKFDTSNRKARRAFYKRINEEVEKIIKQGKQKIQEAKDRGDTVCRITPIGHADYEHWEYSEKEFSENTYLSSISESYAKQQKAVPDHADLAEVPEWTFKSYFRQAVSYRVALHFIKKNFDVYEEQLFVPFYANGDTTMIRFITVTWS